MGSPHLRSVNPLWFAGGIAVLVIAVALIVFPALGGSKGAPVPVNPALASIDPSTLMLPLSDMPVGTRKLGQRDISTAQASKLNGTDLAFLRKTGREIGHEQDYRLADGGEIDLEVVRFRTRNGLQQAYNYFITLPTREHLTPVAFSGVGESSTLVVSQMASFVEFRRGRYYAVVTAVPSSKHNLDLLGTLSRRLDKLIHQGATA